MTSNARSVIVALDSFVAVENDLENVTRLYEIFNGFRVSLDREQAIPAMFRLVERFPEADLGSPGPIVHELEAIEGYEPYLLDSLHRQPTDLTVWMINRILNADLAPEQRQMWLSELRLAAQHPLSPASTRESAAEFLEYQSAKA